MKIVFNWMDYKIMRKIVIGIVLLGLMGCQAKSDYEAAVMEQLKKDQDVVDYKVDINEMTKCVVMETSSKMPGITPLDPRKKEAYENYIRMMKLAASSDPVKEIKELANAFGSAKSLAEARANYAESVVECLNGIVTAGEELLSEQKQAK